MASLSFPIFNPFRSMPPAQDFHKYVKRFAALQSIAMRIGFRVQHGSNGLATAPGGT